MPNLNLYCLSLKYYNHIDNLPSYIKPLGLGNVAYPENWLTEKEGNNISALNKYYGETSGFYWIWKNKLEDLNDNDWIGTCHYRKFLLFIIKTIKPQLSILASTYPVIISHTF